MSKRAAATWLEPRYPWRQLGQQRQELPLREPQQEQAGQPQQQPRLPSCFGLSSRVCRSAAPDPAAVQAGRLCTAET